MTKTRFSHKVMALFLLFMFLPSIIPVNFIYASNNGPNAPEAGAFEPVDATDMVNLVTGDMSYVLPLLNVPSPEGGYPLALSYHAGIAMDQEASWVGLGWNLNPGAINRGVNGYADDWGKTTFNEFFYDEEYDQDFYNFTIGANLPNAFSVGLGASWGSDKAFGGFVQASIGITNTPISISGTLGTSGTTGLGIGANYGGFSANFSTNSIGIGYGNVGKGGTSALGVGLNYNYNTGLSGSFKADAVVGSSSVKSAGLGVEFGSNGISGNTRLNGMGAGISNTSNGISSGSYDTKVSTSSFYLPIYIFYIGYSHTNVKYSLFKNTNLSTSGILYPVEANSLKTYSDGSFSRLLKENNFMDVNVVPEYNGSRDVISLVGEANRQDKNDLVLPSYDNYSVSAQGLSGTLKPYFYSELNLSARGNAEQNQNNTYTTYLNHDIAEYNSSVTSGINVNRNAVKKINFTMDNAYNSFLRTETTGFSNSGLSNNSVGENTVLQFVSTQNSGNYNNNVSLTSENESKKREGNYIKTFTNGEIKRGTALGVIEAKGLNRNDATTFLDEGIGAYQITTLDGKTYHYSLPVYNFETIYRNFKDNSGTPVDDKNFFETQRTTPYATHWLLTSVTGPDYVDANNNGITDKSDYGYWVEFDYGKWSDGYGWRSPSEGYAESVDDDGDITYSYSWGRKQLYYLDAINTRTHTALFVKDLRSDGLSSDNDSYEQKWTSNNFDFDLNPKIIQSSKKVIFAGPGTELFNANGLKVTLPSQIGPCNPINGYEGLRERISYVDIPKNQTLKLSKIILLNNNDNPVNKSNGSYGPSLSKNGAIYLNNRYNLVRGIELGNGSCAAPDYYTQSNVLQEFDVNIDDNVIDVNDIAGLNLENTAVQVIGFDYDYSLAQGTPNSEAIGKGRLTLNRVNFKGKRGIQLLPAYSFSYLNSNYNANNEDDWGYNQYYPQAWSLNEIETPTGGKIKINYEPDSYYAEAATYENMYFDDVNIVQTSPFGATSGYADFEVTINDNINLTDYFVIGKECGLSFKICENAVYTSNTPLVVQNISGNKLYLKANGNTDVIQTTAYKCANNGTSFAGFFDLKIKSNAHPFYTNGQPNGKNGGGIRVKSIEVLGDDTSLSTEYNYQNPLTNKISGITSYAPSKNDVKGIPYVSELPSPMVMYGNVKMTNKDSNGIVLGSTSYEFETLLPAQNQPGYLFSLGEAFSVQEDQDQNFNNGKVVAEKYTIKSALGNLGRLLSVRSYNRFGQKLNENINEYKPISILNANGEIGVTQESHKSLKRVLSRPVNQSVFDTVFYVSSTSRINYPNVLKSTTSRQGDFASTTFIDKHDFLTGQILETSTENSKGLEFMTKKIPAYTKYTGMGSKYDNESFKNMVVQEAANFTYLRDGSNKKTVSAAISKWNGNWTYIDALGQETSPSSFKESIWRKHETFIWDGELDTDGTFLSFNDINQDNFQWGVGTLQTNAKWKRISEVSKYDRNSMVLEVKDLNNNLFSTKMGEDNEKIYAVGSAGYNELFYSGAEDLHQNYFGGNVLRGTGDTTSIIAHTGSRSLLIKSGRTGFIINVEEGMNNQYKASLWSKKGTHTATRLFVGGTMVNYRDNESVISGEWVQLNFYFEVEGTEQIHVATTGSTIYVDDFRVHPVNAIMTSYVYNDWDELTHILGSNNLATFYEYDDVGRLRKSSTESADDPMLLGGFKPVAEYRYNYKLVGQEDTNDNGVVDVGENYDPLTIGRSVPNGFTSPGSLLVIPSGGSGNYRYSYAQGMVTSSAETEALQFGGESTTNQIYVSNVPCTGGSYGYNAYAVRVLVRDVETGKSETALYYFNKNCPTGGGGNPEM